ncbi:MAG: AMP-binding protein [Synergistaceae bacterium]|nr:AMP-binding protein [Synergistaceae bacterium]
MSFTRLNLMIEESLNNHKDEPCYWWQGDWYTCQDLLNLIDDCEAKLKRAGFAEAEGQRLVVMSKNSPMIPALSIAAWRLGGSFCPLNIAAGLESLVNTIELLEPFAVVIAGETKSGVVDELAAQGKEKGWACVTCELGEKIPEFKSKPASPETKDYAVIFATSGTTGAPKAVPLTHGNLIDQCEKVSEFVTPLAPRDVFLTVLPNFHSFGYTCATMLPLSMNARIAIVPSFLPPQAAMKAIIEAKVNVTYAVPAIFSFLLNAVERGKFPKEALSRQKYLCAGGDRLNPKLHEQALHLIGKDIVEGYGLTETSPVVSMTRNYETNRQGTTGPVLTGYEYKLRSRDGQDLNPEEHEGVLWVKGKSVTPGYFRAPRITAERFDDGWFNTGDYVRLEDGYVRILDRVTDILIVGGFNVYPQEVEKVLTEHPDVEAAIVVGVPHPVNGEIPKAFIHRRDGSDLTDRELIKFAKEKLAHYKVPRAIEFVDEFPLSGTGKILRRLLREQSGKKSL